MKVDEASLTGEAELCKKRTGRDPMLLGGTQVIYMTDPGSHMTDEVVIVVV